jgi:hypothetical protein
MVDLQRISTIHQSIQTRSSSTSSSSLPSFLRRLPTTQLFDALVIGQTSRGSPLAGCSTERDPPFCSSSGSLAMHTLTHIFLFKRGLFGSKLL